MTSLPMTVFGLTALRTAVERQQARVQELVADHARARADIRDAADPLAEQQGNESAREREKLVQLQQQYEDAEVICFTAAPQTVQLGSVVTLLTTQAGAAAVRQPEELHVLVVSSVEAQHLPRHFHLKIVSTESPLGSSLLGLSVGESVDIQVPGRAPRQLSVQKIEPYDQALESAGLAI